MKRASITLSDETEQALNAYLKDQEVESPLTAVAEAAIREFLIRRGYIESGKRFYIRSAERGSGRSDISIDHDRYFAEQ